MLRLGIAALVLFGLLAPFYPSAPAPMPCCRGTGQACSCPIRPGFARCPSREPADATPEVLPAILPSAGPALALAISPDALPVLCKGPSALPRRPLVPPPKA